MGILGLIAVRSPQTIRRRLLFFFVFSLWKLPARLWACIAVGVYSFSFIVFYQSGVPCNARRGACQQRGRCQARPMRSRLR